jgi:chromosome segregation ATPase
MTRAADTDHLCCTLCGRNVKRLTQRGRIYVCDACLGENERLRARVAELERDYTAAGTAVIVAKDALNDLSRQVEEARQDQAALRAEVDKLRRRLRDRESAEDALCEQYAHLVTQLREQLLAREGN